MSAIALTRVSTIERIDESIERFTIGEILSIEQSMTHTVDIDPMTSRILTRGIQGMVTVQFLLDLDVEAWLDSNAPGWHLCQSGRSCVHVPEIQIWSNYRNACSGIWSGVDPARFKFQSADHAMLFKLTWA